MARSDSGSCARRPALMMPALKRSTLNASHIVTKKLTMLPLSVTVVVQIKLAHVKDASQVTAAGGASAVPAGGGSSLPHSGGFGHHACRYYGRRGRCPLDWDRRARIIPVPMRTIFAPVGSS